MTRRATSPPCAEAACISAQAAETATAEATVPGDRTRAARGDGQRESLNPDQRGEQMAAITRTVHECSFPVQPPRGSMGAPGPCQCGKTWERAQAEQMLAEALAAMNATEPDDRVGYDYATVIELRRGLVGGSSGADYWQETANRYFGCKAPEAARDAYVGSLMAASYSYTLAAVLGAAASEYGQAVARRLAWIAASVMIDGDDNDLNADLRDPAL
jgi:hypothetical protein